MLEHKDIRINGQSWKWVHFENVSMLGYTLKTDCKKAIGYDHGDDWAGGSWRQAIDRAEKGDESLVKEVDKLVDKISVELDETVAYSYSPSSTGGRVVVPDVVSNSPTPMRLKKSHYSDVAPINIFVDSFTSGGYDPEVMVRRGAASLAVTQNLMRVRPVNLWTYCALSGPNTLHSVKVDTRPLDTSRAAYALCSPQMLRCHYHAQAGHLRGAGNCYLGGYPEKKALQVLEEALDVKVDGSFGCIYLGDKMNWFKSDQKTLEYVTKTLKEFKKED